MCQVAGEIFLKFFLRCAGKLAQGFCFDLGNFMSCCEEEENFVFLGSFCCAFVYIGNVK